MDYQHRFTVFTPTYNRATLLPRLYESLKRQTFRDFEWLIIDDGSTDATPELVEGWLREAPFALRYLRQSNRGKHVAFNHAAWEARGELLLCVDSDDECLPTALERFAKHWADIQSLPPAEAATFSGVTVLCQDQYGRLVGERFPRDIVDSDSNEMQHRFKTTGEKWGFHQTEVFREFPFPEFKNHAFVPESVVWNAMGRRYKTRYVNEVLRVYWQHDGPRLMNSALLADSSPGLALWHHDVLNTNLKYVRYSPVDFIKTSIHYTRFSLHDGVSFRTQWRQLNGPAARALWLGAAPLGWLAYKRDRRAAEPRRPPLISASNSLGDGR